METLVDRVDSGVLCMDHTRFTVNVHRHMFAELGILSIPYPQVWPELTFTTKLWYILVLQWTGGRYCKSVVVTG